MIFFIFALIRSVAKGDDGGSFSGALHGNAIADRGTVFARATRLWLSVALVPFFFILAQLFLVLVAGKTFYNFIAAHPVEPQIPLIVVTRFLEIRGPTLDVRTVRRLRAAGNADVAILSEGEKSGFSGKRNRGGQFGDN